MWATPKDDFPAMVPGAVLQRHPFGFGNGQAQPITMDFLQTVQKLKDALERGMRL